MSDKAITVVPQRQVTLEVVETAQAVAKMAGMFKLQPDQAAIAMLTGYELGLGLMTSLRFVDVISTNNGLRPALRTQAMEALINRSGVLDECTVTEHTDKDGTPTGCTVYMKRTIGGMIKECTSTFTQEDAKRANLDGKSNYQHYPGPMYYSRAYSQGARRVCADVILGLYTPDEITDGEWHVVEDKPPTIQAAESPPQTPPEKGGNGKGDPVAASKASEPVSVEAKEEAPAAETETPAESANANTVAAILAAGHDVSAIQAAVQALKEAGQDVHFPPATSEECQMVMAKLQGEWEMNMDALLKAGYTREQIIQANGGNEPQTVEECEKVIETLSTDAAVAEILKPDTA